MITAAVLDLGIDYKIVRASDILFVCVCGGGCLRSDYIYIYR